MRGQSALGQDHRIAFFHQMAFFKTLEYRLRIMGDLFI